MPDNEIGRVYHPTAEELLLLLSLLDDRPAPMLWPLAVPENTNWALTATRLLQQGFATRTETALVPAPGLAEVLDHLKSADRIAAAVWKSEAPPDPETGLVPEAEQESTLYHSAGGCLAMQWESGLRCTLQPVAEADFLPPLPPLPAQPPAVPPDLPPLPPLTQAAACRGDAACAALVEIFTPDGARRSRWVWHSTGRGCIVRCQSAAGVTAVPDGEPVREALHRALNAREKEDAE